LTTPPQTPRSRKGRVSRFGRWDVVKHELGGGMRRVTGRRKARNNRARTPAEPEPSNANPAAPQPPNGGHRREGWNRTGPGRVQRSVKPLRGTTKNERQALARRCTAGELHRLHPNIYVPAADWATLTETQK